MPAIDASGWLVATMPYDVATTERPTGGRATAGAVYACAAVPPAAVLAAISATTARGRRTLRAMLWRV